MADEKPNVALFATCLVDLFRPTVGFAAARLLEDAGCEVSVPHVQTCCGQPAYNNGDRKDTRRIAAKVIKAFAGYDYVVAPSGSCAAMIRRHYPELFKDDPKRAEAAQDLADRTYELVSFITDVRGRRAVVARHDGSCTYHDSCSGLRELGVREQPRTLLRSVFGLDLHELPDSDVCCGFGGTFCVKYPEISNRMVEEKVKNVQETGAEMLLAGDLGCLMNIWGKLRRDGVDIQVRHVAEVLAGMLDRPPIGEIKPKRDVPSWPPASASVQD
ncbi:MAG: (Fe-S)-binding protein [Alphaproteobacteria bacterium]|nr:(Fe-S)-binding protein [Alphaproteobacteria bacterium]